MAVTLYYAILGMPFSDCEIGVAVLHHLGVLLNYFTLVFSAPSGNRFFFLHQMIVINNNHNNSCVFILEYCIKKTLDGNGKMRINSKNAHKKLMHTFE